MPLPNQTGCKAFVGMLLPYAVRGLTTGDKKGNKNLHVHALARRAAERNEQHMG